MDGTDAEGQQRERDAETDEEVVLPDVDERARWLHRLANLVPLNRARNSKALNYDFDRKKSAYFVGTSGVCAYALTSQVLHTNGWTPTVVAARQDALLDVLQRSWRLA